MSALGLGAAQLGLPYGVSNRGGRPSRAEAAAILACALEGGIRTIDTAPAYGGSEALLGRLLPAGCDAHIVTKTPPLDGGEVTAAACEAVRESAERSLERLRRDRLDGLLVHHGSELALPGGERLARCLIGLREDGLARRLGVSVYDREELDAARDLLPLEIVQLPLNAFDRRFLRDGTLAELQGEGVEVHVRSVFLQGLLLMEPEELPAHLAAAAPPLRRYREWYRGRGLSPLAAALAPVRELAGVDVVLVGASSRRELEECIGAMGARSGAAIEFETPAVEDARLIDPRRWAG